MVITGFYQPGASSVSEIVSYAHNILKDRQSINAIVDTLHIIGSRFNNNRGRYIAMVRTSDVIYSLRMTDSGMEETVIFNP